MKAKTCPFLNKKNHRMLPPCSITLAAPKTHILGPSHRLKRQSAELLKYFILRSTLNTGTGHLQDSDVLCGLSYGDPKS